MAPTVAWHQTAGSARHNTRVSGRFAPSPTGELHVGNLRTAVVAWLAARSRDDGFLVRMEDLDLAQSSLEWERAQLVDLSELGLDWDGEIIRQSDRFAIYRTAIEDLSARGLVYPCYCSRREIRQQIESAVSAPHEMPGAYPGTCRRLDPETQARKRQQGRSPALRLRSDHQAREFFDLRLGRQQGGVDDVVLARADGVPSYNLAVVIDDAAQGVTEVVRGDDLLTSTPRQVLLQELLGLPTPRYLHVPLVVDAEGKRLAKREMPVTLRQLKERGWSQQQLLQILGQSLRFSSPGESVSMTMLIDRFDPALIPQGPMDWTQFLGD